MAQTTPQLIRLRQAIAALTRGYNPGQPRDNHGRFGSMAADAPPQAAEIPERDLTPAQRQLAEAAVNRHGATSQCSYCSMMLNSPLSGQRLGFRFHLTGVHLNDSFCPDCMWRSLYTGYRNLGHSATVARQRATAMTARVFTAGEIHQWSAHPSAYAGHPHRPEEERMATLDMIRRHLATLALPAVLRGEYEYTTTDGVEHLVTTGAHGQWVNNEVIGKVGNTSAKSAGGKGGGARMTQQRWDAEFAQIKSQQQALWIEHQQLGAKAQRTPEEEARLRHITHESLRLDKQLLELARNRPTLSAKTLSAREQTAARMERWNAEQDRVRRETPNATFDPQRMWRFVGGDPNELYANLRTEATGILETILNDPNMPPGPRATSLTKDAFARNIVERLDKHFNGDRATFGRNAKPATKAISVADPRSAAYQREIGGAA